MNALKILVGSGLLAVLWYFTPLLDILKLFFIIVIIPLATVAAIGLITDGTYNWIISIPSALDELKNRTVQYREVGAAAFDATAWEVPPP